MATPSLFGRQLKYWRQVRGMSQLSLATLASTTTRHVSFLENGRSRPSDTMVMRLAEALEVPIRERNQLLQAAGFAGTYAVEPLDAEAQAPFQQAVEYMLKNHAPYPAIVKNRYHEVINLNEPAKRLFMKVDPAGMRKSMIEWALEPGGRAEEVFENYQAVAWSLIYRVRGEAAAAPNDKRLQCLAALAESRAKSLDPGYQTTDLLTCPTLNLDEGRVSLMGMTAQFGSAQDAHLEELKLELMYPRDPETDSFFQELAKAPVLRVAK